MTLALTLVFTAGGSVATPAPAAQPADDWLSHATDHFNVYYRAALRPDLERIAGHAERAYRQVSADLRHDLTARVSLILFETTSQLEEQRTAAPGPPEHLLLALDDPSGRLDTLLTHELTHVFEFDIIPQSPGGRRIPSWVSEGLADYERGTWAPLDLAEVRQAALADHVPRVRGIDGSDRLARHLGHAAFEFIAARYRKAGIRRFLLALRRNVLSGGEGVYEEAFQMTPDEFDRAFEQYLKERFRP